MTTREDFLITRPSADGISTILLPIQKRQSSNMAPCAQLQTYDSRIHGRAFFIFFEKALFFCDMV